MKQHINAASKQTNKKQTKMRSGNNNIIIIIIITIIITLAQINFIIETIAHIGQMSQYSYESTEGKQETGD
jgi:hypothetical protein